MDNNNNVCGTLKKDINALRASLEDAEDRTQEKLEAICDSIDDLELKLEEISSNFRASKNGKLLWKISNFEEAFNRAVNGEEESILSDFIYTGHYGYKLQAVAYLNGVAAGKGTHLSLYLVIHKSEYDAVLPWPFRQKVNFTLLNLNGDNSKKDDNDDNSKKDDKDLHANDGDNKDNDLREELVGNRMSSSFTRPKSDTNPGWGFPTFVKHDQLKSDFFIKEDSIFIKLEIQPYDCF